MQEVIKHHTGLKVTKIRYCTLTHVYECLMKIDDGRTRLIGKDAPLSFAKFIDIVATSRRYSYPNAKKAGSLIDPYDVCNDLEEWTKSPLQGFTQEQQDGLENIIWDLARAFESTCASIKAEL